MPPQKNRWRAPSRFDSYEPVFDLPNFQKGMVTRHGSSNTVQLQVNITNFSVWWIALKHLITYFLSGLHLLNHFKAITNIAEKKKMRAGLCIVYYIRLYKPIIQCNHMCNHNQYVCNHLFNVQMIPDIGFPRTTLFSSIYSSQNSIYQKCMCIYYIAYMYVQANHSATKSL